MGTVVTTDYSDPDPLPDDIEDVEEETISDPEPKGKASDPAPVKETTGKEEESKKDEKPDEGLKKALADTKRAYTKAAMELAELKGRMSAMETKPTPVPEKDWLDEFEDDSLRLNPELAKEMIRKHRQDVVQLLEQRDRFWEGQLKNLDPDVLTMKDRIAELRQDPDYQAFTDKQLAIVAKKQKRSEVVDEEPEPVLSSGAPGAGRGSGGGGHDVNIRETPLFKKIYPGGIK